jgi:hypothetical protein
VFISTDAGGVGLNLQSASVLINLDVPWNPAVLEQRNARVHRLGQTRKVQIINMVSTDSYEERVLALVGNKQLLFDNVVSEDAKEDVVGISKKLLETLLDDLAETTPASQPAETPPEPESTEDLATAPEIAGTERNTKEDPLEKALTGCVAELQRTFGERIERIFGSGGGLIVVLDQVDNEADLVAERLSAVVPVALIDRLALKGLQRLGPASPLAEAKIYAETPVAPDSPSPLARTAARKLQAATLLMEQQRADSAPDLLVAALMAAAADRAGLESPLNSQEAGVWLFGPGVSRGYLSIDEANLIMRVMVLAQGTTVPRELLNTLVDEVTVFVGQTV